MYARRLPTHTYDHTRRSKDDILVYSENELRHVLGNVPRGKRVVITSEIFITRTIDVKVAKKQSTLLTAQEVIVSGFGSGKLTRKANVDEPFDLFNLETEDENVFDPVGLRFEGLSIDGFRYAFMIGRLDASPIFIPSPTTMVGLIITGCSLYRSYALLGGISSGPAGISTTFKGGEVSNNRLYSTGTGGVSIDCAISSDAGSGIGIMHIVDTVVSGNETVPVNNATPEWPASVVDPTLQVSATDSHIINNTMSGELRVGVFTRNQISGNHVQGEDSVINSLMPIVTLPNDAVVSGNIFENNLEINLVRSVLSSNNIKGNITNTFFPPTGSGLRVVGNLFANTNVFPRAECCIVRDNMGLGNRDVDGYGRISLAGEVLGQTIIDTTNLFSNTPFVKSVTSAVYSKLVNDVNVADDPSVSFHVPCNKKVKVSLRCWLRDMQDGATPANYDEIGMNLRTSGGTIPLTNCNHTQAFIFAEDNSTIPPVVNGFSPVTFEWYVDGNIGGFWPDAGIPETFEFWVRVESAAGALMEVEVWGGRGTAPDGTTQYAGPMIATVEAVSDDLNFIIPSEPP